jgi:ketosteroid isomerase-like protein
VTGRGARHDGPVHPTDAVRRLYELYQDRDWSAAARLLHEDARLRMPATDERLAGRERIIALQREYPEPWGELRVERVTGDGGTAAAEVEIVAPDEVHRCAAFWTVRDGLLVDGVEYWVVVGGETADPQRRPAG